MKQAVAWFADNPVAANLLMLFILIFGTITVAGIKLEIFPETELDKISISVAYPGSSPSEVEEGVIKRIEENVAGLEGIKRIDSVAREGSAGITIEVMSGWNIKKLLDEVKSEVDRITTMPEEAEEPVIREITRRSQVLSIAVYGNVPESTIKHVAQTARDDLTALDGITVAELAAVRSNEIHMEISETTLRKYGLTLNSVANAVTRSSLDLPAGSVEADEGEVLIRTKGRRYYADEYQDVPVITRPDGSRVTLGSIADIREGFADVDLSSRFQSRPSAIVNVFRVADQNALDVAAAAKEYVKQTSPSLPRGIEMQHYQDMSTILKSRIELLTTNMLLGLALVSILLGIFLNIRLAFWVTLGIPVSFAFGMMLLPYFNVSLNMISLFAFIMVLGIVVDDAIIVGENVFRHQEEGAGRLKAAAEGTIEVGRPVVFAVLTTMVAFGPLLMAGGTMGKLMRHIPVVVILVLLGSLVESLFILPAHLARSKAVRKEGKKPKMMSRFLLWVINRPYHRLVRFCVKWRYATLSFGLAVLLLTAGVWAAGMVKFTFFPKVEGDVLECRITMPAGIPAERTENVIARVEKAARKMIAEKEKDRPSDAPPLLEHTASIMGAQFGGRGGSDSGAHLAQVWVQLLEGEKRKISSAALTREWRNRVGGIQDAESLTFKNEIHSAGNPVEVHLSLENHDLLLSAAKELKTELERFEGVFDISDSYMPGKMEMQLKLKPSAQSLGIKLADLARQVRHAFYGAEAMRFQRGKNEVKVLVRFPDSERKTLASVEDMRIRTPSGSEVPFSVVADVHFERGYASIERARRKRVIKVYADVNENITNANEVRRHLTAEYLPKLRNRYAGLKYTIEGEGSEQKEVMGDVVKGFIVALFCIYALLAVPFKSFSQPLIVMAAIPFGIVGAVLGHLILGFNVSIISLFGIVGLSGVVVNDSLVLIHRVNDLRKQGLNAFDAVSEGGKLRFRAIILTSLTTFGGLTPMMLEKSLQARFLIPMAISLGFGVLFATLITLLLVPCGYMVLDDFHNIINKIKSLAGFESEADREYERV